MVKTLLGYSLVSHLWRNYDLTMSDIFLPLILKLIHKHFKYSMHKSSIPNLVNFFRDEYNLDLPTLNIINLLQRDNSGSLTIRDDYYILNADCFKDAYPNLFTDKREKAIEAAYHAIQKYACETYKLDCTIAEVDNSLTELLLSFPKTIFHDLKIELEVPNYSEKEIHRVIAEYIANCDPETIEVFKDIFIGCILSHVIGLKEKQGVDLYENNVKVFHDCVIYIDTPILIPLLKASDEFSTNMYQELIEILQKSGAIIKTLSHIVSEVESILSTALNIIQGRYIYNGRINPATMYFMNNRDKLLHLELLVNDIESYIINELNFDIVDFIQDANNQYMIDTGKLEDLIKKVYSDKEHADYFEVLRYTTPINTDVTSIAAIQCFREGITPRKLIDSKHLLLTKNWGLFKAANEYKDDTDSSVNLSLIILIDTYISALIWNVQQKNLIDEYYKQKLLVDCLNVISPNSEFIDNFMKAVTEYSTKSYLTDAETKNLMLNPDYIRSAYMRCGNDSSCIFETLEEIQENLKATYTKPIAAELDEVRGDLTEAIKEKSRLESDLDLKSRTLDLVRNDLNEKASQIEQLEKENSEHIRESIYSKFKRKHWFCIQIKYLLQRAIIIEFILGLIPIAIAIFTTWLVLIIDFVYLIIRIIFRLQDRYKVNTWDDVARELFDKEYVK